MKRAIGMLMFAVLASCSLPPSQGLDPSIDGELNKGAQRKPKPPPSVEQALLPPARMAMPEVSGLTTERRFDLSVSNAPAHQVFMSIVSGTRYSMLVHPNVSGSITVNLKDVTIQEALGALRELYGYEYKIEGNRIFIQPVAIQTRVFNVNYLIGQRLGRSDVRVTSGSIADVPNIGSGQPGTPGYPGAGGAVPTGIPGAAGALLPGVTDSSRIQTQTRNDFWEVLEKTLVAIVGVEPGRSVVVNSQAGIVVVRAMPAELRGIENYLKAVRASVERQVVLEAKIIEVTLNQQYQAGINWAAFSSGGLSVGQVSPGTALQRRSDGSTPGPLSSGATLGIDTATGAPSVGSAVLSALPGSTLINTSVPGASLFGLAFETRNFAAMLSFLETQGGVQVLSSPRIATINNQKAVLKVGIDQFFLTSITGNATTSAVGSTGAAVPAFPNITLRPFFSGVALDITPQIDENSNIILHIHPSVSNVQEEKRQVDLGQTFGGAVNLPVAKSNVSETDSVVKVGDGNILAIGGLMKVDVENVRSGLPGTSDGGIIGALTGSTTRTMVKKELVILVKPTVVQADGETAEDLRQRERIRGMFPSSSIAPSPFAGGR